MSAPDRFFLSDRDEEWSTEKPADPIELRIYRGADGDFTLYEDENDNYNYEKGAYATIPLHWDDAAQHADHRRPQRTVPRHAGRPFFPRSLCKRKSWSWNRLRGGG